MQSVRFGPEKVVLLPVLLALFGAVPLALSVLPLRWLLLLPVAAAIWVVRARVVVDARGLTVCNGLRVHRHAWDDVQGVEVPRLGPVRLLLTGSSGGTASRALTALPRHDVPRLLALAPRAGA